MKKRLLTIFLALLLIGALVLPASAAELPDLTEQDWYYNEVRAMVSQGHISGYPDGTFRGEEEMSLAEFVTLLARLLGRECGQTAAGWAGLQMDSALRDGWLNSNEYTNLDWDAPITRQLSAKVLVEALELEVSWIPALLDFHDLGEIAPEYLPYVAAGYEAGLYKGDADGNFYPLGGLIRGGAATLLYRAVHRGEMVLGRYTKAEVIDYFVEVALRGEYDAQGNPGKSNPVVKWTEPIYYHVGPGATEEDLAQLNKMVQRMNQIQGFPGLIETADEELADLPIVFLSIDEMDYYPGYYNPYMDGFARVHWYIPSYSIYMGDVAYRAEGLDQFTRNSVICEELIQVMGMLNDSEKYADSIFYQHGSSVQWPSDLDWKIMELLYDSRLLCGMEEQACRQVLNEIL